MKIYKTPSELYTCAKCGCDDFDYMKKNRVENIIGLYCNKCGRWLKWASKDEKNLISMEGKSNG